MCFSLTTASSVCVGGRNPPHSGQTRFKQAYMLSTAQTTFKKKEDFCCQCLASCPSLPGRSTSGRAGSKDSEAPSPSPWPQPRRSLKRGNFQSSLRRNSALLPSLSGKKQLLRYPPKHLQPSPRFWPVALTGDAHTTTPTNHPLSPLPQAQPPFCGPRLSCAAQARLRAGPGRQHGGRAEARAGHHRAAGNRALGRRLYQRGPEL